MTEKNRQPICALCELEIDGRVFTDGRDRYCAECAFRMGTPEARGWPSDEQAREIRDRLEAKRLGESFEPEPKKPN